MKPLCISEVLKYEMPDMRLSLLLLYIWSAAGARELSSPYPSTVPGIDIQNTHQVEEFIIRGMVPRTAEEILQLEKFGVKKILIFRNDSEGETGARDERELIERTVGAKFKIEHIPFKWKELTSFQEPCLQLLEGLRHLREAQLKSETIYFHCTVGEDRTGLLSGIYRHLFGPALGQMDIFRNEMCARGYARGDPNKEEWVVDLIHNNLTDLYVKLLYLLQTKQLTSALEDRACSRDPILDKAFRATYKSAMDRYRCPMVHPQ